MQTPFVYFDNREKLPSWFIRILKFIPKSQTVFVLTNSVKSTKIINNANIKFVKLSELDYQDKYSKFTKIYKHLSSHTELFELACFERYFAINSCMSKFELHAAWHLDTDVLPTSGLNLYSEFNLVFSSPYKDLSVASAHTAKFSKKGIESLINYLLNSFYQENLPNLETIYLDRKSKGLLGGITDMTAIAYWLRTLEPSSWYNSFDNVRSDMRINHIFAMLETDFFSKEHSVKQGIYMIKLKPYSIEVKSSQKTLRYASLHFQGHYKNLVPTLLTLKYLIGNLKIFLILIKIIVKIKKELTKILTLFK
jgi:hypothetical protein